MKKLKAILSWFFIKKKNEKINNTRELIADMNVLAARYDANLSGRKTEKKDLNTEKSETEVSSV